MKEREIISVMPNSPEDSLLLSTPETLRAKPTLEGLLLVGSSRIIIANIMTGRTEAKIRTPLTLLELPTSSGFVEEITVAVRGNAIFILSASTDKGPITLPTVTAASDKAPEGRDQNSSVPTSKLRLDVQVSSEVENEVAAMIKRLEPTEQRKGDKVHWTTHLLQSAQSLTKQVRDSTETLPPPRHTQSIAGGEITTFLRRAFRRETLQKEIDVTMPSVVASVLVRIMENTEAGGGNMDALRQVIAGHMTTVASGQLPNSDHKPSRGFIQFAQFILSLKPKDVPEELGHTNRAARTPAELMRILSGAASDAKIGDVKANSLAAQESALRQVQERCATLARTRVPEDQQAAYDAEIGKLLQTARLSQAFQQLKADEQRTVGGRLNHAAGILAKRENVQPKDVTKSVLAKSRDGKAISPNLRQKPE